MDETQVSYKSYDFGDSLDPGRRLKLEHSVSCEGADISDLTGMSAAALQAMREESVAGENKAFEIVLAAVKQWEKQAAVTQRIDRAMEYIRTPAIKHTANQWQENEYGTGEQISNMVYTMTARIWEDTKYDRETEKMVPVAWYVSWDVYAKGPGRNGHTASIAGQRNKRYTDKAAALKYLAGRKKAYAHLFTEISPPIPPEYASLFKVNGQLLPGYTLEGQEPIQTEHATAEVSDGGISLPKEAEKPSVLGKLSAARTQDKVPSVDPVTKKKKEDVSR